MIGGAIWKIFKDDAEEIIYAVDYNISKERHVPQAQIEVLAQGSRPSLLITDSLQIKKKRCLQTAHRSTYLNVLADAGRSGEGWWGAKPPPHTRPLARAALRRFICTDVFANSISMMLPRAPVRLVGFTNEKI